MKGVYTLLLFLERDIDVGRWSLKRGFYCYTGSGLSNMLARIERHFERKKRIKWHIDLLTTHEDVRVLGAVLAGSLERMECRVNRELEALGEAIRGFGSTDCKGGCAGHLVRGPEVKAVLKVYRRLGLKPLIWDNGIIG